MKLAAQGLPQGGGVGFEMIRGEQGFGYDPLFWVPDHQCSSAELAPETKNRISHRGQAMQSLLDRLQALNS